MVKTMNKNCTLNNLPLDKSGIISSIKCKEYLINRIYDMGILENTIIKPLYRSPFGDPTAYLVKNTVIALRKKDSKYITVTPIN